MGDSLAILAVRTLRIAADIFYDKSVITKPRGGCNDRLAAAEFM